VSKLKLGIDIEVSRIGDGFTVASKETRVLSADARAAGESISRMAETLTAPARAAATLASVAAALQSIGGNAKSSTSDISNLNSSIQRMTQSLSAQAQMRTALANISALPSASKAPTPAPESAASRDHLATLSHEREQLELQLKIASQIDPVKKRQLVTELDVLKVTQRESDAVRRILADERLSLAERSKIVAAVKSNTEAEVNLTRATHAAASAANDLANNTKSAGSSGESALGVFRQIATTIGLAALAWKGFDAVKSMISEGIAFNSQMEQSKLGLAAIIGQFAIIKDSSGHVLTGFNNQLLVAGQLQEKLKTLALQTTAEYTDLVTALQSSLGPGLRAFGKESGDTLDKVLKFTQDAALAWGAMGRDMKMLPQEMRALLKGEAGPDNELVNLLFSDKIGKGGGLQKYIKELQDAGKYSAELGKRMESFTKVGQYAGNTLAGAWSNLKDAFTQALGAGTQGQFGAITQLVKDLTAKVVTFDEKGKATFNPEFVRSISDITTAFVNMATALAGVADKLPGILNYMARLASPNLSGLVGGAAGGFLGGLAGHPIAGAMAGYAGVTALTGGTDVQGANATPEDIVMGRIHDFNDWLRTLDAGARARAVAFYKSIPDPMANAQDPNSILRLHSLTPEGWRGAIKGKDDTLTVTAKPPGGAVVDPKAEALARRLKDAIDDLTASSKVYGEEQDKLAAKASFEGLMEKEDAALRKLDAQRQVSAAGFAVMIAQTSDPIKKLELERAASLDSLTGDAAKFQAEQEKQLLQLKAALQALDDEVAVYKDKQAKQLQDLMQKGVTFGSANYLAAVAAQQDELKALNSRQVVEKGNLNEKIKGMEVDLTNFTGVQAAERTKVMTESDRAISDAHFEQLTARLDAERAFQQEVLSSTRTFAQRMRDQYADMAQHISGAIRNGINSLLKGGDLQSSMQDMADFFNGMIAEAFGGLFDNFFARIAAHANNQPAPGEVGPPSPRQAKNAQLGMLGIQSATALYGLYTNPAPSRGQNMLSGAMTGASLGFAYGAIAGGITAIPAAIIGAIIGAIAGAFAPTEKGKNVKITGKGGGFSITGMESDWGAAKLKREIDQAVRGTAAKLDAIFTGLPTAALEAIANWRPDLSMIDVTGKGDGKNWNEELDNYLKETLPGRVFDAYGGSIAAALKFAGATDKKLTEFRAYLATLKTDEAIKAVSDYINVLYGFKDLLDMFNGPKPGGRQRSVGKGGTAPSAGEIFAGNVYKRADAGPLVAFEDMSKRIAALSHGFDDLTHEEQVARGQQILDLSRQFFSGIEEYLLKLRDQQRALNESLDAQSREITLDQMTDPKKKVEFLLAEQRRLYDQLAKATTSDEVNRISGLMQQNVGSIYDLLGRTPEAAKQAQAEIEIIRKLANERYALFEKNAQKMVDDAYGIIKAILLKLQDGLDTVIGGTGGGGGGGVIPPVIKDPHDIDPNDPGYTGYATLGAVASSSAATISGSFTPSISDATAKILQFSSAVSAASSATLAPPTVHVQLGDTHVDVQLSGTAEKVVDVITARAAAAAVEKVFSVLDNRAARSAMTGRR
jgi:hypothetical protein